MRSYLKSTTSSAFPFVRARIQASSYQTPWGSDHSSAMTRKKNARASSQSTLPCWSQLNLYAFDQFLFSRNARLISFSSLPCSDRRFKVGALAVTLQCLSHTQPGASPHTIQHAILNPKPGPPLATTPQSPQTHKSRRNQR